MCATLIQTEADHRVALARIVALMDAVTGSPEADELSVLAELVQAYEEKHFPIAPPTKAGAVRFRLEQMNQS